MHIKKVVVVAHDKSTICLSKRDVLLCSATGFLNKREKMPVGLNDNTIVVKYANKENHTKSGKK